MTDYLRPTSLEEALTCRAEHPDWWVVAGGTDLMVGVTTRANPPGMVDLFGLDSLVGISSDGETIRIGAATPYAVLLADPTVRGHLAALWACVREIGAVQIQARGTIGGNVVTSSPVGDTLPVLLALDATVELASTAGRRTLAYADFITGYRTTALKADELLVAISIPVPDRRTRQYWRKVGTRRAQAISKVMMAAAATLDGGRVASCRIAMGAIADRPIRLPAAEQALRGQSPDATTAEAVRDAVTESITPIDDVRSSARYRREVAGNIARRFVLSLA